MADKQESLSEQGTASVNPSTSTPDAELDELLNSALDDFDKPPPSRPATVQKSGSESNVLNVPDGLEGEWTEEFIKQAAAQFEQNMQSLLSQNVVFATNKSNEDEVEDTSFSLLKRWSGNIPVVVDTQLLTEMVSGKIREKIYGYIF